MTAKADKIFVLGLDGMDPRFTKYMVEKGKMPSVKKLLERGAAREDLAMLGGNPTITPPMWATLATGANPATHGITCFWNQHPDKLDTLVYAFGSDVCQAEQVWNVLAESGKKTLVFHWPGGSWPPSSDSENLHVIEGTQPPGVHNGIGILDEDVVIYADINHAETVHMGAIKAAPGVGCVIEGMEVKPGSAKESQRMNMNGMEMKNFLFFHEDGEAITEQIKSIDRYQVQLKDAQNWANAPEGAKEFALITVKGTRQLPCLLLKNEQGIYDRVAIYKNKKAAEPLLVMHENEFVDEFMDEVPDKNGEKKRGVRNANVFEIAPDGSKVTLWFGKALNVDIEPVLWHPQTLYKEVIANAGYVPAVHTNAANYPELVEKRLLPSWHNYTKWQSRAMNYLLKEHGYEMVFSHNHMIDIFGHTMLRMTKDRQEYREKFGTDAALYESYFEQAYEYADEYIGSFLHLLDEGWTMMVVSDHGLLCAEEDEIPFLGEGFGINVRAMMEMGYTTMMKDENGDDLREIDWSKTTAVAARGNHIYINLKGRNSTGIVDPKDKYDLETKIITDLYNYRVDGKRMIQLAVRNKDAAHFGMDGEKSGDIIYFIEEGFNRIHGDALSTTLGFNHTSVAPIFIAAGKGIKHCTTKRVVREIDVAPTVAALAGIRMPRECEGAPVYQIIAE